MHESRWREMRRNLHGRLRQFWDDMIGIADIGSRMVNPEYPHTYREHMRSNWIYTGLDTEDGENVDTLMSGPYSIPAPSATYDAVISGQCLEHVENPFRLVVEMARVLTPGGLMILTAPWKQAMHPHPVDCWRILPDGMAALAKHAGLGLICAYTAGRMDCWGVMRKPRT